jgi:hypothetical protein
MGNTEKGREAIADPRSETETALIPAGPGRWKLNIVAPGD